MQQTLKKRQVCLVVSKDLKVTDILDTLISNVSFSMSGKWQAFLSDGKFNSPTRQFIPRFSKRIHHLWE
jgi:hypothetical protein